MYQGVKKRLQYIRIFSENFRSQSNNFNGKISSHAFHQNIAVFATSKKLLVSAPKTKLADCYTYQLCYGVRKLMFENFFWYKNHKNKHVHVTPKPFSSDKKPYAFFWARFGRNFRSWRNNWKKLFNTVNSRRFQLSARFCTLIGPNLLPKTEESRRNKHTEVDTQLEM